MNKTFFSTNKKALPMFGSVTVRLQNTNDFKVLVEKTSDPVVNELNRFVFHLIPETPEAKVRLEVALKTLRENGSIKGNLIGNGVSTNGFVYDVRSELDVNLYLVNKFIKNDKDAKLFSLSPPLQLTEPLGFTGEILLGDMDKILGLLFGEKTMKVMKEGNNPLRKNITQR